MDPTETLPSLGESVSSCRFASTFRRQPVVKWSGVIGFLTDSESWGAGAFHVGHWWEDRVRYVGAFLVPSVNLAFYGGGDGPSSNFGLDYNPEGWHLEGEFGSGNIPFYALPDISLRGIPAMRCQSAHALMTEAEVRWDLDSRWSVLGSAGVGAVAESLDEFGDSKARWTGGGGFRYLLARQLSLRAGLDVAVGPEESVVYIQVGHAWGHQPRGATSGVCVGGARSGFEPGELSRERCHAPTPPQPDGTMKSQPLSRSQRWSAGQKGLLDKSGVFRHMYAGMSRGARGQTREFRCRPSRPSTGRWRCQVVRQNTMAPRGCVRRGRKQTFVPDDRPPSPVCGFAFGRRL